MKPMPPPPPFVGTFRQRNRALRDQWAFEFAQHIFAARLHKPYSMIHGLPGQTITPIPDGLPSTPEDIARIAVAQADALLNALRDTEGGAV